LKGGFGGVDGDWHTNEKVNIHLLKNLKKRKMQNEEELSEINC
jgi:hypothetical protein